MQIIRKIYYDGQYLGKFRLKKTKNKYIWVYILDFSKDARQADSFNISKERFDNIKGCEWINATYRDGESKKTKVVFSLDFEDGDI